MVFRGIREFFHVDSHEYLSSLTGKYILSELASTGKSGSFFYYSRDYRFIIKTIHDSEHKVLLQMLKNYYQHVQSNPHTLLSRIFGLHRVKRPGNKKIHFVVMANVFPIHKDIHEVFDLKGSLLGRSISEEEVVKSPQAVMKDLNWLEKGKSIRLGPEKGEIFMIQLERDVDFLKANKIMDYSLLIGIHDIIKGNADDIRNNTLSLFHPSASTSLLQRGIGSVAKAMRVTMAGISSPNISESIPLERKFCVFYEDEGGFRATDPHNIPLDEIYYLGLIDIFTKYGIKKRLETFIKSMGLDKKKISAVNPVYYADRFLRFVTKSIKGCEHKPIPAEAIFTNSLLDHKASGNLPAAVLRSKRALNHSTSDVG